MVTKRHMLHQYRWPSKLISAAIKILVNSAYHALISITHVYLLLHTPSFLPTPKFSWGEEGLPPFMPTIKLNTLLGTPSRRWEGRKGHLETKTNQSYINDREGHAPLKSNGYAPAQIARQRSLQGFNFRKPRLELRQILQATATTKSKWNQLNNEQAAKWNTHHDRQEMLEPMCHCANPSSLSNVSTNLLTPIFHPSLSRNLQDCWHDHWE